MANRSIVAVLDAGATNLKVLAIDRSGRIVATRMRRNRHLGDPYLHIDAESIRCFVMEALAELAASHRIDAIVATSHGSALALLDREGGLALPIMYYEAEPPKEVRRSYLDQEPAFEEVKAPTNPATLTLGLQLHWQETRFGEAFARVATILPYAQYWTSILTGAMASEVTSLGAQTHLWAPERRDFSSLAKRRGWDRLFAPIGSAWTSPGVLDPSVGKRTGLSQDTLVLTGIHDSNANYLRFKRGKLDRFTLMSTGTWLINFDTEFPVSDLPFDRDTVSNTDAWGDPVACSRYMAGREYALLAGDDPGLPDQDSVTSLVAAGVQALPSFTTLGGPFPWTGGQGRIEGPMPDAPAARAALACLHTALMASESIEVLNSKATVVIDGPFAHNPVFCGLVAALREGQDVLVSRTRDGTALGAAALVDCFEGIDSPPLDLAPVRPLRVPGFPDYARHWRTRIGDQP